MNGFALTNTGWIHCSISDGDITSPYTIAGNHEPATYSAGATTGALATVILKNLDSNKAAGQDRTMQDAALTSLTFRMDSGTSGGRLIASGSLYCFFI